MVKTRDNCNLDRLIIVKGNGPILITGPHSVETIRHKPEREIHGAEANINCIINKLYKSLGPKLCTVMMWNKKYIEDNALYPSDPNFEYDLKKSLWYKQFKKLKITKPFFYLHLDLHGMLDTSTKNDIELGMKAIHLYRPGLSQHMKPIIREAFKKMEETFSFHSHFQGWGGINKYTLSNQGSLLGFYSIQIELSTTTRSRFCKKKKSFNKFTKVIREIYKEWKKEMKKPKHKHKTIKHKRKKAKNKKKTRKNFYKNSYSK